MTILLIALGTAAATLIGGLFALRFKDKLHLILGFSAGAVVGVAFFDLLPESLSLIGAEKISLGTLLIAAGFIAYLVIDRTITLHAHDDSHEEVKHNHYGRGVLGAASLSFHSLLDGLAVGFAFQVSSGIGLIVAAAVLTHDFSDGINTVGMILKSTPDWHKAFRWLLVDAIAPVVGILIASSFVISEQTLGVLLAVFTGFFLYIGASDLLPESHHHHPTAWTTIATVLGVTVLFSATRLAGL